MGSGLQAVCNGAEDLADLRTQQNEDGDHDDCHKGDDQRVLDQPLALLSGAQQGLLHNGVPLSSQRKPGLFFPFAAQHPQCAEPMPFPDVRSRHLDHLERSVGVARK